MKCTFKRDDLVILQILDKNGNEISPQRVLSEG